LVIQTSRTSPTGLRCSLLWARYFCSLPKKRNTCITTLCQSFNCSLCYDLWQSWLLWLSI